MALIAVTGASGFVGRQLVPAILERGHQCRSLTREELAAPAAELQGVHTVIHLAAIAHTNAATDEDYVRVNRDLPVTLAQAAANAGVSRFVFVSSTHALTHRDTAYGRAKAEAEAALAGLSGIEIRIARPPLVYGPGAKANMGNLARLVATPLPLPFAAETAPRSLIYVGNLVDALLFLAETKLLAEPAYTVTDPEPASLAMIVEELRAGRGMPPRLFRAPWLRVLLEGLGRRRLASKLFDADVFDGAPLRQAGWQPPFGTREALRLTGSSP